MSAQPHSIVRIVLVGGRCYETKPCKHECVCEMVDGTTHSVRLSAHMIMQFYDQLPPSDQAHFRYLRKDDDVTVRPK